MGLNQLYKPVFKSWRLNERMVKHFHQFELFINITHNLNLSTFISYALSYIVHFNFTAAQFFMFIDAKKFTAPLVRVANIKHLALLVNSLRIE